MEFSDGHSSLPRLRLVYALPFQCWGGGRFFVDDPEGIRGGVHVPLPSVGYGAPLPHLGESPLFCSSVNPNVHARGSQIDSCKFWISTVVDIATATRACPLSLQNKRGGTC